MGPIPGPMIWVRSRVAKVAGSMEESAMVAKVMGMKATFSGISSKNLSTWQSLQPQEVLGSLLRASATMCRPALAELCLKMTLLLLTQASSCWSRALVECLPSFMRAAASTTGLLSGRTMVGK